MKTMLLILCLAALIVAGHEVRRNTKKDIIIDSLNQDNKILKHQLENVTIQLYFSDYGKKERKSQKYY